MDSIVDRARQLAEELNKPQGKEDWARNGDAAEQFLTMEFFAEPRSADELIAVHSALYMKVGHKRLGRIYNLVVKDADL